MRKTLTTILAGVILTGASLGLSQKAYCGESYKKPNAQYLKYQEQIRKTNETKNIKDLPNEIQQIALRGNEIPDEYVLCGFRVKPQHTYYSDSVDFIYMKKSDTKKKPDEDKSIEVSNFGIWISSFRFDYDMIGAEPHDDTLSRFDEAYSYKEEGVTRVVGVWNDARKEVDFSPYMKRLADRLKMKKIWPRN